MRLEHEADGVVAKCAETSLVEGNDVLPGDFETAPVEAVERSEHVEKRRLANSRGADDGDDLAIVHLEIGATQDDEPARWRAVGLLDRRSGEQDRSAHSYLSDSAGTTRAALQCRVEGCDETHEECSRDHSRRLDRHETEWNVGDLVDVLRHSEQPVVIEDYDRLPNPRPFPWPFPSRRWSCPGP